MKERADIDTKVKADCRERLLAYLTGVRENTGHFQDAREVLEDWLAETAREAEQATHMLYLDVVDRMTPE
jgi:hypothetical protein